jgi:hypothetical protein
VGEPRIRVLRERTYASADEHNLYRVGRIPL